MITFLYDKTFDGLLTAVFNSYEMKIIPDEIVSEDVWQKNFFSTNYSIVTDENKAERVWAGLESKISGKACQMPYRAYLSELNYEKLIFSFIRKVFDSNYNIEKNYADDIVLQIKQLTRKVTREAQRMLEFIRFQKTTDNIFYASIAPSYNVLPIIIKHFEKRFPDQHWIIYDLKRNWGVYYNLKEVIEINMTLDSVDKGTGRISKPIMEENEELYQYLWKDYFDAINITERKNLKLQMNFMPKRFWRYLIEKNVDMLKINEI